MIIPRKTTFVFREIIDYRQLKQLAKLEVQGDKMTERLTSCQLKGSEKNERKKKISKQENQVFSENFKC